MNAAEKLAKSNGKGQCNTDQVASPDDKTQSHREGARNLTQLKLNQMGELRTNR
jgi:hypothetical protein